MSLCSCYIWRTYGFFEFWICEHDESLWLLHHNKNWLAWNKLHNPISTEWEKLEILAWSDHKDALLLASAILGWRVSSIHDQMIIVSYGRHRRSTQFYSRLISWRWMQRKVKIGARCCIWCQIGRTSLIILSLLDRDMHVIRFLEAFAINHVEDSTHFE